jgi:hypothetical protein
LESAHEIRIVLQHLAESLSAVLQDRAEVESAVNALLERQRQRAERKKQGGNAPASSTPAPTAAPGDGGSNLSQGRSNAEWTDGK